MKIRILKPFNHEGNLFHPEEIRVVSEELGDYFLRAGWVEDVDGIRATGTPSLNDTILLIEDLSTDSNVPEVL